MPKCTFLVGVPGSGKSTWFEKTQVGQLISSDEIIESVAAEYEMSYNEVFQDLIKFADKAMWRNLELCAQDQEDVVIDRTNLTVKSRKRFMNFLKGYEFEAFVFPTPEETEWRRRLDSRPGKTIPAHVLVSMLKNFESPTEKEGFSKITYVLS
jgi:predicted kinase